MDGIGKSGSGPAAIGLVDSGSGSASESEDPSACAEPHAGFCSSPSRRRKVSTGSRQ